MHPRTAEGEETMGFGEPKSSTTEPSPRPASPWRLYLLIAILVALALLLLSAFVFAPP